MVFYYIRHGEPIYNPDSLTELGHKQAKALSKYFLDIGLDEIYSSTSNRAMQTAEPTCEVLGLKAELLDFANEGHAWNEFSIENGNGKKWLFQSDKARALFSDKSIKELGYEWYKHSELVDYHYEKSMERVYNECDNLFYRFGYEHERYSGRYKIISPNDKKIALFAHEGFGRAFLSCLFDIPYPYICNHFEMCHTGITVIKFNDNEEYSIPQLKCFSATPHLYAERFR
ncbi:MAG: histidine phosphatase family protein [Clostridia bacterium]|nr:histidine phosphatase family protein [Clostridia bacterium]